MLFRCLLILKCHIFISDNTYSKFHARIPWYCVNGGQWNIFCNLCYLYSFSWEIVMLYELSYLFFFFFSHGNSSVAFNFIRRLFASNTVVFLYKFGRPQNFQFFHLNKCYKLFFVCVINLVFLKSGVSQL